MHMSTSRHFYIFHKGHQNASLSSLLTKSKSNKFASQPYAKKKTITFSEPTPSAPMKLSILPFLFLIQGALGQRVTYYSCGKTGKNEYSTFSTRSFLRFNLRVYLANHVRGRCDEVCSNLCGYQECMNYFQVSRDDKCTCLGIASTPVVCTDPNQVCIQDECIEKESFPPNIQFRLDPWLPAEDKEDTAQRLAMPSLTQPFYNTVLDVRATVSASSLSLIFSTNGNWMAGLMKLLDTKFLPENPSVKESYLITTSPPISGAQMTSGLLKVGNIMYKDAQPHAIAGPGGYINGFEASGFGSGDRIPIIKTYGNIILKRKGDASIQNFADLANLEPGRFASSDPAEGGSYNNYKGSIYNLVVNNPDLMGATTEAEAIEKATALQAHLFDEAGVATIGGPMHRSVPHTIATGHADAGLFFLHLAVVAMQENPGVFEAIYLAKDKVGSTDDPSVLLQGQDPLEGNRVGTFFVLRTNTTVNEDQELAREAFIQDLKSPEFTTILTEVGLRRPE